MPFDPGQALTIRADTGTVVEVRAFGQQLPLAIKTNGDQPVDGPVFEMLLLHRDNTLPERVEHQSPVTAVIQAGQLLTAPLLQRLTVQLLVCLIDEYQLVASKAKRSAAIFIDPAAHTVAIRSQPSDAVRRPLHYRATPFPRQKLHPEHPLFIAGQIGVIRAAGNRFGSGKGTGPMAGCVNPCR